MILLTLSCSSQYMVWYIANHSLAQAARKICRSLWTPAMEAHGIPLAQLTPLVERLATWRDEHLSKVGVPSVWPASWDFVAAVTACGSDSNYHCTWLVVNRALSDYDILEARRARDGSGPPCPEAEMVRERIAQEALHAALRISALVCPLSLVLSVSHPTLTCKHLCMIPRPPSLRPMVISDWTRTFSTSPSTRPASSSPS